MNYLSRLAAGINHIQVRLQNSVRDHQGLLLGALISLVLLLPMSAFLTSRPVDALVFSAPLIHSEHSAVKTALSHFTPVNFWSTDVYEIADQINELTWVNKVGVSKAWPNKLIINIKSEELVAKWNESEYLNAAGKIVTSFRVPVQLPNVYSSPAKSKQAVTLLSAIESKLTRVSSLSVSKSGAIFAVLASGIEINFGAEAFTARLERVSRLLNSKARKGRQIERIDARYPKGLAVVWHDGLASLTGGR